MSDPQSRLATALADHYTIERELGAGGMATVYLAHDTKHHRKVALKVLRPELAALIGSERFLNEITVTANLQHPHILQLFDSGDADGFLFYVMPYVDGESLRDLLAREKQLDIDEAVQITRNVASALDYAHRRGVIHRDIKPENVLLHEGQPMVADFGIALAVSQAGGTRLTETGLSIGTPQYMSPEQAMGDRELDARSDVYSLGVMLFEMLAGDPPFMGSTAQAIVAKVITESAPVVTTSRPTTPPNVAAAVQKAMAKLPADRFHSAAEFAEALANPAFVAKGGTTAIPSAIMPLGRDRRVLGLGAAAVVLALLAAWGWLGRGDAAARPVIRYSMAMPSGQELIPAVGPRLTLSPDGSRLVYVGPGDGGQALWVRERRQLEARVLAGTQRGEQPTFSPDGQQVAFLTPGPIMIKVASLGGGPPVTVIDSGVQRAGLTWSPDGYLYADGVEGLLRVRPSGPPLEVASRIDSAAGEISHTWPSALPGGRGVLFTVWRGAGANVAEHDIAVLDVATGEHRILVRGVAARYAPTGHLVYVTAGGALMAAPFDERRLELTGPATALIEGVGVRLVGGIDVAIAATGTLMYVTGGVTEEPHELVWVDRAGAARPIDPGWVGEFYTLELSPDGSRLAVGMQMPGGRDLWIKHLDTGPFSRLTFPDGQDHRPSWTPDGTSVLFISERGPNRDLYRKRADGVGQAEVVLDLEDPVNQGLLSRDGAWLVYRTGRNNVLDIFARRMSGDTTPVRLIADPNINEHSPALSPDGRWIAYVSDESGRWELYVRPFPNVNDGRWQVSTAGGSEPRWARSGRELFYKNAADQLVAAEIQTSPTFVVGQQRVLFSTATMYSYAFQPQYDVANDHERFVMIRLRGVGEAGELIVVESWFEELMERVPPDR